MSCTSTLPEWWVHQWDAAVDEGGGRLLPGIHGLRMHVVDVVATSEFDDHEPGQHRLAVADRLEQRDRAHDHKARSQQLRRADMPRTGPT